MARSVMHRSMAFARLPFDGETYLADVRMFQQEGFGAVYLIDDERKAIIETGTSWDAGQILQAVKGFGLRPGDIDALVVSHIHLDHAGGAGFLLDDMPRAKVYVHERGFKHLVEPTKLVVQFDGIGFHVPFWKLPLLIVIFAFLSSPLSYFLRLRVRKRRGTRGELVLRLIQIRLATSSLERISPGCQANSPRPRIADSSSTNAVSFSSARTRGPRRDHSSTLNNCSTSGIVVNAPTATSVQPIARLCSAVSFSESNSAMPAPSIARVPAMRPI